MRLTKGKEVVETPLVVALDPKAPFTLADRKAQYDEAMKAHALFGRMSDVVDRLNGYRALASARAKGLPDGDAVRKDLDAFAAKADAIRKDVVATSEGGAITGEERLREHLAYVYDAILSYEGRPGDYQVERVAVLERELKDVEARAADSRREGSPGAQREAAREEARADRRGRGRARGRADRGGADDRGRVDRSERRPRGGEEPPTRAGVKGGGGAARRRLRILTAQ